MDWTRKAAVAGRFYPDDAEELRTTLRGFCPEAEKKTSPIAIMAPHAGYIYSGKIAGEVYRQIQIPETVFILCPNHTGRGTPISVWAKGVWETPLGALSVDEPLAHAFLQTLGGLAPDSASHLTEHAIEVHLPFIQFLNPNTKIVPVVLAHLDLEKTLAVGQAIAKTIRESEKRVLIIASTDMSHFISAQEASALDHLALAQVEAIRPKALFETVCKHQISMCGFIPTTAALSASSQLGAKQAKILAYGSSGEVNRDFDSVVGYASAWVL